MFELLNAMPTPPGCGYEPGTPPRTPLPATLPPGTPSPLPFDAMPEAPTLPRPSCLAARAAQLREEVASFTALFASPAKRPTREPAQDPLPDSTPGRGRVRGSLSGRGTTPRPEAGTTESAGEDPAALIDILRTMEELKATAAAVQAAAAVRFDLLQRREQQRLGVRAEELGRGVGAQVALARRDSPARGGRHLGLAKALLQELPCTFRALSAGVLTEWRATLVARETACLDPGDRAEVDRVIAGDLEEVSRLGDRAIVAKLRRLTYRIDPESAVRRSRKAEGERNVSCRPAPDTMTYLTGLLPVAQGVAVYASLSREADRVRAAGDPRGRGQIMADTLVERVTGAPACGGQRVEVQLIMTDRTLLHGGREPAVLAGYGVVPGRWAREAVAEASEAAIRRLYTAPESRDLVAMESRARIFPAGLARFIGARDQFCRTPWCGAPIRHIDHVRPHATGGTTSAGNGQGLCESCNYAKDAPGWSTTPDGAAAGCTPDSTAGQSAFAAGKSGGSGSDGGGGESHRGGRGSVEKGSAGTDAGPARSDPPLSPHLTRPPGARSFIRTPTGHVYESAAPMPPGAESEV